MSCWKKKYGIAKDWNSTSQPAFNMPFEKSSCARKRDERIVCTTPPGCEIHEFGSAGKSHNYFEYGDLKDVIYAKLCFDWSVHWEHCPQCEDVFASAEKKARSQFDWW